MDIPLGRPTAYPEHYDPGLLAPIERATVRSTMGIAVAPAFVGADVWNGYEFSWLSERGMPRVAGIRLRVDAGSPFMVESKSMKLYLNGFALTRFATPAVVRDLIQTDLGRAFGAAVGVALPELDAIEPASGRLPGASLDDVELEIGDYQREPALLALDPHAPAVAEEALHTHLFRSLCPVTGQPDWASLLIRYSGPAMDRAGLLRYLVSYRNHQAFHEATIEQIFVDLKDRCGCERLLVAGYFLRRGGLDINPLRADPGEAWAPLRLPRQ